MTFTDPYRTIIVEPVELPARPRPHEEPAVPDRESAPEREPTPLREPAPALPPDQPDPVPAGAVSPRHNSSR